MKENKIIEKVSMRPRHMKKLHRLRNIEKKMFHPMQHHIHKKHNISKKTIFYMKEYGPHTNVARTILKESVKILFLASLISSLGGFALENIKDSIVSFAPIIIMLPVLNGTIGNYGIVISSKFSTMLHEGKVNGKITIGKELKKLFFQILIISFLTTTMSGILAILISGRGYESYEIAMRMIAISVLDVLFLISILFAVSIAAGIYFFRKGEDPNNFLIPITTSIADFGNMIILAVLVSILL